MPSSIFECLAKSNPAVKATTLDPPHIYNGISTTTSQNSSTRCTKVTTLDVQLGIRHGSQLLLRSVEWKVEQPNLDYVIIGRPILQSTGCDNKAIIAATCEKNDGVINVPEVLEADAKKRRAETEGTIASIMKTGVYHSTATEGDGGLEDTQVYIDLGDDDPQVLDEALKKRVDEAKQNGMTQRGAEKLTSLLDEFKQVFE